METVKKLIELANRQFNTQKDVLDYLKDYILKTYNDINTIENPAILANSVNLIRYVIENDTYVKDEEYTKFYYIVKDCSYKLDDQTDSLRRDIDKCLKNNINSIVEKNKSDYENFRNQFIKMMTEDEIRKSYAKYKGLI